MAQRSRSGSLSDKFSGVLNRFKRKKNYSEISTNYHISLNFSPCIRATSVRNGEGYPICCQGRACEESYS